MNIKRQLALQRLREAEILITILRSEAKLTQLKLEEADMQVGMARAYLNSRKIYDESEDETLPLEHQDPADSVGPDSESSSDYEGMIPRNSALTI